MQKDASINQNISSLLLISALQIEIICSTSHVPLLPLEHLFFFIDS